MNLVLFAPDEWRQPMDPTDVRARHLVEILKLSPGDRFAAGEEAGPYGTLEFRGWDVGKLIFALPEWTGTPAPPTQVRMIVGTPRPPTARRLLKDLTTLGASQLHFAATDLGDKSYLQSTLWSGEYHQNLWEGASQARTTYLPPVQTHSSLKRALTVVGTDPLVWFDEGGVAWDRHAIHDQASLGGPLWLALGPERGWSPSEREYLESRGYQRAGLGPRTLRTETACALALGVAVLRGWL